MRIRRAWPVVLFLVAVAVSSRVTNRQSLRPNSDESRHNTDCDNSGKKGDERRGGNLEPLSLTDLPTRKLIFHIWGPGVFGAFAGAWFGHWLAGDNDVALLKLVNLLVGPCAVLIGTSIIAATFAGNWEMTAHQARRRENLLLHSWLLSFFAVLAILTAVVYAALATVPESSNPLSDSNIRNLGAVATGLLSGSVFGFIPLTFRIVRLVIHQTTDHQSEPRPLDE